ncbi:hypothetical protein C4559_03625 [Candidatus Microgenomates bacterium]|nr:MAG: hypothetical protein C4559_03625 [Candidatus Microgenomates bacterium]
MYFFSERAIVAKGEKARERREAPECQELANKIDEAAMALGLNLDRSLSEAHADTALTFLTAGDDGKQNPVSLQEYNKSTCCPLDPENQYSFIAVSKNFAGVNVSLMRLAGFNSSSDVQLVMEFEIAKKSAESSRLEYDSSIEPLQFRHISVLHPLILTSTVTSSPLPKA